MCKYWSVCVIVFVATTLYHCIPTYIYVKISLPFCLALSLLPLHFA